MRIDLEDQNTPEIKKVIGKPFEKGHTLSVGIGRKGKEDKTISKQLMTVVEDKKAFKHKVQTVGLTRLWLIMENLPDLQFLQTMIAVMPYAIPKIASIEARDDKGNEIHNIDDAQQVHTITIKDMRTGQSTTILSE